jgi:hypothetical protein
MHTLHAEEAKKMATRMWPSSASASASTISSGRRVGQRAPAGSGGTWQGGRCQWCGSLPTAVAIPGACRLPHRGGRVSSVHLGGANGAAFAAYSDGIGPGMLGRDWGGEFGEGQWWLLSGIEEQGGVGGYEE